MSDHAALVATIEWAHDKLAKLHAEMDKAVKKHPICSGEHYLFAQRNVRAVMHSLDARMNPKLAAALAEEER